jgi:hypothetical protein
MMAACAMRLAVAILAMAARYGSYDTFLVLLLCSILYLMLYARCAIKFAFSQSANTCAKQNAKRTVFVVVVFLGSPSPSSRWR